MKTVLDPGWFLALNTDLFRVFFCPSLISLWSHGSLEDLLGTGEHRLNLAKWWFFSPPSPKCCHGNAYNMDLLRAQLKMQSRRQKRNTIVHVVFSQHSACLGLYVNMKTFLHYRRKTCSESCWVTMEFPTCHVKCTKREHPPSLCPLWLQCEQNDCEHGKIKQAQGLVWIRITTNDLVIKQKSHKKKK